MSATSSVQRRGEPMRAHLWATGRQPAAGQRVLRVEWVSNDLGNVCRNPRSCPRSTSRDVASLGNSVIVAVITRVRTRSHSRRLGPATMQNAWRPCGRWQGLDASRKRSRERHTSEGMPTRGCQWAAQRGDQPGATLPHGLQEEPDLPTPRFGTSAPTHHDGHIQ